MIFRNLLLDALHSLLIISKGDELDISNQTTPHSTPELCGHSGDHNSVVLFMPEIDCLFFPEYLPKHKFLLRVEIELFLPDVPVTGIAVNHAESHLVANLHNQ